MLDLSVVICTHNPRSDYLHRVLDALKVQTLPNTRWELLLIDNASKEPLADAWDISWHPTARHICEEELGLTPARLRGIREATSELLIFIDDDNVLFPNYLEQALRIGQAWPLLGAWGGQCHPEFEKEPEEWQKEFVLHLTIREFDRDMWSNSVGRGRTVPVGAGLCVRKAIGLHYLHKVAGSPLKRFLDRTGNMLYGFGDLDLAMSAMDLGLGTGIFKDLRLKHLLAAQRVEVAYLEKLLEDSSFSEVIFDYTRGFQPVKKSVSLRVYEFYCRLRIHPLARRLARAIDRGYSKGISEIEKLEQTKDGAS